MPKEPSLWVWIFTTLILQMRIQRQYVLKARVHAWWESGVWLMSRCPESSSIYVFSQTRKNVNRITCKFGMIMFSPSLHCPNPSSHSYNIYFFLGLYCWFSSCLYLFPLFFIPVLIWIDVYSKMEGELHQKEVTLGCASTAGTPEETW